MIINDHLPFAEAVQLGSEVKFGSECDETQLDGRKNDFLKDCKSHPMTVFLERVMVASLERLQGTVIENGTLEPGC